MSDSPATRLPLHTRILLGLGLGAGAGALGHEGALRDPAAWFATQIAAPTGQLFLSLLLMLVVPLVFASLVVGVAGIGDLRRLGRVGLKSFLFSIVMSAISVGIGIGLANSVEPGLQLDTRIAGELRAAYGDVATAQISAAGSAAATAEKAPLARIIESLVPRNPIASLATPTPDMLHLMCFALVLGLGATLLPRERALPFVAMLEALSDIVARLIGLVMRLAPVAVFCLVFVNVQQFGLGLLVSLGWFVGTVLLGLALHLFGVYSLAIRWLAGASPRAFFRAIRTAMLTAFSTSSSSATLPTALRVGEEELGIPKEINSFVLTVGATANQNGTALYEGLTVLFLAQLAGVELSLAQQLMVVYLAILGGIGTAGVPAGSIPFVIGILATIGVDPALIAVVLGVDRILDMCRTTLNVSGDLAAAAWVARSEGHTLRVTGAAEPVRIAGD